MYGETYSISFLTLKTKGLSPRVRGNHGRGRGNYEVVRSIPACTGKPDLFRHQQLPGVVYPRVYGETMQNVDSAATVTGLSPRVRGNLTARLLAVERLRSIPACTGKPHLGRALDIAIQVYPRVYGETCSRSPGETGSRGLSPRVRGNRHALQADAVPGRSIPACTGKPYPGQMKKCHVEVYPRVYGETQGLDGVITHCAGLSPRVRGNH